jgi:hypothetical protein
VKADRAREKETDAVRRLFFGNLVGEPWVVGGTNVTLTQTSNFWEIRFAQRSAASSSLFEITGAEASGWLVRLVELVMQAKEESKESEILKTINNWVYTNVPFA